MSEGCGLRGSLPGFRKVQQVAYVVQINQDGPSNILRIRYLGENLIARSIQPKTRRDLDDLIRYESENTCLDFKAVHYSKDQYEARIKDVMAMANSDTSEDRFIICGVKHHLSGSRDLVRVPKAEFVDAATYQQLTRENVEPTIELDYFAHELDGKLLGVFRISKCQDQPYVMRKDFKSLKQGNGFIRKGTHQTPLGSTGGPERSRVKFFLASAAWDSRPSLNFLSC